MAKLTFNSDMYSIAGGRTYDITSSTSVIPFTKFIYILYGERIITDENTTT